MAGWIGVDLDGTLAKYDGWKGNRHIGEPVQKMADRVRVWLSNGIEVRVVTARANDGPEIVALIQDWCFKHVGERLAVTTSKDYSMVELWDDRAVQVEKNTGRRMDGTEDPPDYFDLVHM